MLGEAYAGLEAACQSEDTGGRSQAIVMAHHEASTISPAGKSQLSRLRCLGLVLPWLGELGQAVK